jgi:hypothetical protein
MAEHAPSFSVSSVLPAPAAVVPTTIINPNGKLHVSSPPLLPALTLPEPPTGIKAALDGPLAIITSSAPIAPVRTPAPVVEIDENGEVIVPGQIPPVPAVTSIPPPAIPSQPIPPPEVPSSPPAPIPPMSSVANPPEAILSLEPPPAVPTSIPPVPPLSLVNPPPKVFSSAIDLKGDQGNLPPVLQDNDRPKAASTSA